MTREVIAIPLVCTADDVSRDMRSYEALTRSLFAENELVDRYRTLIGLDRVKADTAVVVS